MLNKYQSPWFVEALQSEGKLEINELKVGNYLPQSHIPITLEDKNDLPDYYLLLSHNFADEIIKKNKDIIAKGVKFIIPFPHVEIVGR